MEDLYEDLKKRAPTTLALIERVTIKPRRDRELTFMSDPSKVEQRQRVAVMSYSILLNEKSQRTNGMQLLMSMFFIKTGASKDTFNFGQQLGICLSYDATWDFLKGYIKVLDEELITVASAHRYRAFMIVFDNINMLKRVATRIGRQNEMYNFTAGFIIQLFRTNPDLGMDDLPAMGRDQLQYEQLLPDKSDYNTLETYTQFIVIEFALRYFGDTDRWTRPLSDDNTATTTARGSSASNTKKGMSKELRKLLRARMIELQAELKRTQHEGFPDFLNENVKPLPPRTPVHPFDMMDKDESMPREVIEILKTILKTLRVNDEFAARLFVCGDSFTCARIRTVIRMMSFDWGAPEDAQLTRDLQNIVDIPGDFHWGWAFIKVVFAVSYGEQKDLGSLSFLAALLEKKTSDREAKNFFRAEELMTLQLQGYIAGYFCYYVEHDMDKAVTGGFTIDTSHIVYQVY
jgi:hypothetical protein